jgi:hypothetical protein
VQRLLGRFAAQGFVFNDCLARFAQSSDPFPCVALIGRCYLYGTGSTRLHEVLIHVTALWSDPKPPREETLPQEARQ